MSDLKELKEYLDRISKGEDTVPGDIRNSDQTIEDSIYYDTELYIKGAADFARYIKNQYIDVPIYEHIDLEYQIDETLRNFLSVFGIVKNRKEKKHLVRCKDCIFKHYSESNNLWCNIIEKIMPENGYCCFGDSGVNLAELDEELVDKFNEISYTSFWLTSEEIERLLNEQETT